MKTLLLSITLSITSAAVAAAPALACGGGGATETRLGQVSPLATDARELVEAHFAALARGDQKAVRRLWSKRPAIVSYAADGSSKRLGFRAALRRWVAKRDGMTWQVVSADPRTDGGIDVRVTVTWGGAAYDDVLTVMPDGEGTLRLIAKTTRPQATELAVAPSPY
jgi:hypothetical protein